jgi:hypothetical protein
MLSVFKNSKTTYLGREVEVTVLIEPTSFEFDGTPPSDYEGWDLTVEVRLKVDGYEFCGLASENGIWDPVDEIDATIEMLIPHLQIKAIQDLEQDEIKHAASGEELKNMEAYLEQTKQRQKAAIWLTEFKKNYNG